MNSWTLCLLISSFVPIPHISAITSVTCGCHKTDIKCALLLGQKDRKNGTLDFYPARVMKRLQIAEALEAEPYYKQHIRQAWIVLSFLQKGMTDAFVQSSYVVYGCHPDNVWPNIVADRKARLGAEYHDFYDSADVLRPDVPKFSPTPADNHAAIGPDSLTESVGPFPTIRQKGIV